MKKLNLIVAPLCGAFAIASCAVNPNTGNVGLSSAVADPAVLSCAGGALVGVIVANQIGDIRRSSNEGAWKTAAGIGGCAAGAQIYSAVHPNDIHETVLHNKTGEASSWASRVNGQSGNYSITPTSNVIENTVGIDGKSYSGCRYYQIDTVDRETNLPITETGQACMNDRGEMVLLSSGHS